MNASTTETIITQLQQAFAPIAAKIGEGAAYGWDIVVKQQAINGIGYFLWAGAAFLVSIGLLTLTISCIKYAKKDDELWGVASFLVFFTLAAFVVSGIFVFYGVAHMINPEYYAIQYFINLVRPEAR